MIFKKQLLPLLCLCLLWACGQSALTNDNVSQKMKEIPVLLDRPEKVRHGSEWDDIQNRYAANRDKAVANPNDAEARIQLAEVFINEARITGEHGHYYPAALTMLDAVLFNEIKDNNLKFRALTTKAGVQLSLHQFSQALETGQMAMTLNAHNAQIFGVLVDAHVELGEYDKAVEMADRMMAIRPDLRSYSRVSYLREIHGDVPGAIEAMEMAVQAGHPALEETAWAMLTLGELYQRYDQPNKALAIYDALLENRANHPFAIGAKGNVYLEEKNYEQAEILLSQAMAIIPEVGFYMDMAKLYKETGRQTETVKLTDEILEMLQDDLNSGHNMNLEMAEVHAHFKNDHDTALKYALVEYAVRPKNIDVNRQLALLYQEMGLTEKAAEHAKAAAATNSKHPDLLALSQMIRQPDSQQL